MLLISLLPKSTYNSKNSQYYFIIKAESICWNSCTIYSGKCPGRKRICSTWRPDTHSRQHLSKLPGCCVLLCVCTQTSKWEDTAHIRSCRLKKFVFLLTLFVSLRYTSYNGIGMDPEGALSMREDGAARSLWLRYNPLFTCCEHVIFCDF